MKAYLFLAAAFAASVHGGVIEARQRRTSTREPDTPSIPDVTKCGLDGFVGHTSQALSFCSQLLGTGGGGQGKTTTQTVTTTTREIITSKTTVYTTLYPPSNKPPSSTRKPTSTAPPPPSSVKPTSTPPPQTTAGCGLVGYTGSVAAYYFDSSGTKNTWAACSAACKADTKCKSFGYGEANCLLFDVVATGNVNINPMSPYTFYDVQCPKELPVRKRQLGITLNLPDGPISACQCLIGTGGPDKTTTTTVVSSTKSTTTQTVTRTVSLLPEDGRRKA